MTFDVIELLFSYLARIFRGAFGEDYGHTPLSVDEEIPWKCRRLAIGTGAYDSLPVMKEVRLEAERRKVELRILPTAQAIGVLRGNPNETNAILHVTC